MHHEHVTFQVEGLRCGGCVRRLRTQLEQLTGSEGIHIDLATGQCSIEDSPLPRDAVVASLAEMGYSASPDS